MSNRFGEEYIEEERRELHSHLLVVKRLMFAMKEEDLSPNVTIF